MKHICLLILILYSINIYSDNIYTYNAYQSTIYPIGATSVINENYNIQMSSLPINPGEPIPDPEIEQTPIGDAPILLIILFLILYIKIHKRKYIN